VAIARQGPDGCRTTFGQFLIVTSPIRPHANTPTRKITRNGWVPGRKRIAGPTTWEMRNSSGRPQGGAFRAGTFGRPVLGPRGAGRIVLASMVAKLVMGFSSAQARSGPDPAAGPSGIPALRLAPASLGRARPGAKSLMDLGSVQLVGARRSVPSRFDSRMVVARSSPIDGRP
jgi:hypothetical protein